MAQATEHLYIVTDDQVLSGEPIINGARTPVRAIVETWRLGVAPEEISHRLPHLALAQVCDALSYYCGHREEIHSLRAGGTRQARAIIRSLASTTGRGLGVRDRLGVDTMARAPEGVDVSDALES